MKLRGYLFSDVLAYPVNMLIRLSIPCVDEPQQDLSLLTSTVSCYQHQSQHLITLHTRQITNVSRLTEVECEWMSRTGYCDRWHDPHLSKSENAVKMLCSAAAMAEQIVEKDLSLQLKQNAQ